MLINVLYIIYKKLKNHKNIVQTVLLCAIFSFLNIEPSPDRLMSSESLYNQIGLSKAQLFENISKPFEDSFPNQTIMIIFTGSENFKKLTKEIVSRLKLRSKTIKFSSKPTNENYFIKVYLKESDINCLKIHPLRNYQPNSDLLYLAKQVFKPTYRFQIRDLFILKFENWVDLEITNEKRSLERVCLLLRLFMNLESHYYGLYYYIPTRTGLIKAEPIFLFNIGILLIVFSESLPLLNPYSLFVATILNYFCPLCCFFYLKKKISIMYGLVFTVINYKIALIYCILLGIIITNHKIQLLLQTKAIY